MLGLGVGFWNRIRFIHRDRRSSDSFRDLALDVSKLYFHQGGPRDIEKIWNVVTLWALSGFGAAFTIYRITILGFVPERDQIGFSLDPLALKRLHSRRNTLKICKRIPAATM